MKRSAVIRHSALLLILAGCSSETDPPETKGPRIISFAVNPTSVEVGAQVQLSWETVGANGVNIEPRIGLQAATGTEQDQPLVTTTYTLSIPGGPADLKEQATVQVTGGPPRVDAFNATPRTISAGGAATLEWATSNAESVVIEPGLGTKNPQGSEQVTPQVTTTYRLTAIKGQQVSPASEVTISVTGGNEPVITSFRASPQTIQSGGSSTLSWETQNANVVTISGVSGQQLTTGNTSVSPATTTTYTLTAVGDGGQATASVTITVNQSGDPVVLSFNANPATIAPGGSAVLSWDTDNADGVRIDNGVGNKPAKGDTTVTPAQTTTYTLDAFNAVNQVSQQVTVTVAAQNQPVITMFSVQPSVITVGGTATLNWTTQNATSVDIDNSVGTGLSPNDSIQVNPNQTTTYTLTANGTGNPATQQVTLTVNPAPPTVVSFTTTPASIVSGGTATLNWTTQNATGVTIDNGVGSQAANGSAQVSPTQSTIYTLTANGSGGAANAQVTVTVTTQGAPVINSFTASPQQIAPGGQSTLSWNVSDATSVTIDNGIGSQPNSGTAQVSPATNTTYTMTAIGPGGQTTAQVAITVVSVVGDTCADAFVINGSGNFTGNTNTATNNYEETNTCTNFRSAGPDVVYSVSLQSGDQISAVLTPSGWDAAIYMVTGCSDIAASCVAGEDNGGADERIDYTAATAGDFYIMVDGFSSAGGGDYTLAVTITPAPIANDQCSGAINVTAGGTFSGDTTNAAGDYDPGFGGCTGYTAAANDVAFLVMLQAGERLQASLDAAWDAALYVVSDCSDVTANCLQGQDSGNPEEIDYTTPAAGTFFLIVDAWGSAKGPFDLTVTISPPVQGGDTCQSAVAIPAGGGSFQSTTVGLNDDYAPSSCASTFTQNGPDQTYSINLGLSDVVEIAAAFDPALDGSVYVVTDCANVDTTCIAGADDGLTGETEEIRFVAESAVPHYVILDAFSASDSGPHDLTLTHYTGETCGEAPPLNLTNTSEFFSTTGMTNDYSPNSGGCTGFSANGPDRVYSVAVTPGDQVQVTIDPDGFDASLYIVSNCADVSGTCLEGSDLGVNANELIQPVFQQSGTHYVIVDAFSSAEGDGTIQAKVARGDTCADAYRVPAAGGTFQGTTSGYAADYGTAQSSGSCTNYAQEGADAVYAITLDNNKTLNASVDTTWDSSLYLISDCANSATTCLAGQDNGNPEEITYINSSGASATYYLIIDSWKTSDSITRDGNYTLTIGVQ